MIYPEYERYSTKFNEVQERFMQVLLEKERLFTKTLPNAMLMEILLRTMSFLWMRKTLMRN